jgi:hypothetical protein
MLTLYFSPGSSSMATHIALNEIGVPFEAKLTALHENAHRAPGYLAVNPEGKVPTLMIDGRPLTEVAATLWYLARRHPEAGLLPQYGDTEGEARVIYGCRSSPRRSTRPAAPATSAGVRSSRSPNSASAVTIGRSTAIRSATSTCSGCSGVLSMHCIPTAAATPAFLRITTA